MTTDSKNKILRKKHWNALVDDGSQRKQKLLETVFLMGIGEYIL